MGHHFTWFDLLHIDHKLTYVAMSLLVTTLIVVMSVVGRLALGNGEAAIQPATGLTIKGFFEALTEFVVAIIKMVLGASKLYYAPIFGAIFFFLIVNNLVGLVPGLTAATSNINAALAVGLFSFILYNIEGFKHSGVHYFKHFMGPVWWMAPLLLPIELISNMIRPITLGIRLSVNMTADHTVLGAFLDLTKVVIPVIFYGMGTFVSFVQAFVFTMLSMVYVLMATADDH